MNKKYDDDFFEDLDKTTDLLKAFRPHVASKTNDLDDLFNEYMNTQKKSQEIEKSEVDELTRSIKPIRTMKEAYELEAEIKEQQRIKREQEELERQKQAEKQRQLLIEQQQAEMQKQLLIEQKQAELQEIFNDKEQSKKQKKKQEKTDLNEILGKMSESVEQKKQEKLRKEQEKQLKIEKKQNKKKDNVKFTKFELTFCALSFLFIIGCIWAFNTNTDKEDKKETVVSLSTAITRSTPVYAGDGLYTNNNTYIYKGKDSNNYLSYSNMLWRILKVNEDNTIDLVLDNSINSLKWSESVKPYLESDIHKYLNNYFVYYLDDTYLEKVDICLDEVENSKNFKCDNKNNDFYVRLLTLDEFNESKSDDSFISNTNNSFWLSTKYNDKVWAIRGNTISLDDSNLLLGIKPVIKIKGNLELLSGNGSKDNPYKITKDKDEIKVGDYIKLDNDEYVVYDIHDDRLILASTTVLPNVAFDVDSASFDITKSTNIGYYLNNDYLNGLSYNNLLLENEWYKGAYIDSYENIYNDSVVSKIGIYDVASLKFDSDLVDYYLLNPLYANVLVYNNESYSINNADIKGIRTTICITKTNISSGTGSKNDPFILER